MHNSPFFFTSMTFGSSKAARLGRRVGNQFVVVTEMHWARQKKKRENRKKGKRTPPRPPPVSFSFSLSVFMSSHAIANFSRSPRLYIEYLIRAANHAGNRAGLSRFQNRSGITVIRYLNRTITSGIPRREMLSSDTRVADVKFVIFLYHCRNGVFSWRACTGRNK